MNDWRIFRGDKTRQPGFALPPPPPWRDFRRAAEHRGITYQISEDEVRLVNAALYLRRPLLVTGAPGSGKSSLPFAIAEELGLGPVLRWSINSRSTLTEGLYRYDALARLRDASLAQAQTLQKTMRPDSALTEPSSPPDIGNYVTLGPLGTALLPSDRPRILLIDEIDKSDIDLPNDLLHVFEEGRFEIPELVRAAGQQPSVRVLPADGTTESDKVCIQCGRVEALEFPLVIITSNGERELPLPFLRRCVRLETSQLDAKKLENIVRAHLGNVDAEPVGQLIGQFLETLKNGGVLAVDQLLNAAYFVIGQRAPSPSDWESLREVLMRPLNEE